MLREMEEGALYPDFLFSDKKFLNIKKLIIQNNP